MKKYIVIYEQEPSCDCSIGCGLVYETIEAESYEDIWAYIKNDIRENYNYDMLYMDLI